jgi:RimJ/RimL family protein N-acetyltransferase
MSVRVRLEPWAESDLDLLRAMNAPEMMGHLGGSETEEKLLSRNRRYADLAGTGKGRMFRVVLADSGETAGSIGYWERDHQGETVYETGWTVLAAFQGRGVATAAAVAAAEAARAERKHRYLLAYPRTDHPASNAVCRKAGFELLGENSYEYPAGNPIRCNDWRLDLDPSPA